jgi:microcin C transport system substrate-binding protein
MNRRSLLGSIIFAPATLNFPVRWVTSARAEQKNWQHGLSLFGELKYPADFQHFDYVNPNAPKGGAIRQVAIGTFDNFNGVVAGVKGALVADIGLIYDRLTAPSLDEASSAYGLLAEAINRAADFSSVSYLLRAEAKWHDGAPVIPDDVIFSFEAFRRYSPQQAAYYRQVTAVEKTGEREITFTFAGPGNRELPQIVGELTVLPKHWWEGRDGAGKKRDIGVTTLEPPLGSGAYRIKEFSPRRNVVYERVKDYWGRSVNANIGTNNLDELSMTIFAIQPSLSRRSKPA